MRTLRQDIRYGLRTLTKTPGFTLAAIVTLALGIGANTAIFSVVHSLMFRPLKVEEPERLVSIVQRNRDGRFYLAISFPEYLEYRELKDIFEDVVAFNSGRAQMTADGLPERVTTTLTTGNYFSVLGLRAEMGRVFTDEEGDIGGEPYILLSHGYWQARFGGDPAILGKPVSLNGQPVTVIGVTPEDFQGTVGFVSTDVYVPFGAWQLIDPGLEDSLRDRSGWGWKSVGRLRPGVTLAQARSAVETVATTLEKEYPESNENRRAFVFPEPLTRLEPSAAEYLPPVALVFMAMVSLVLLIACANVANLLLARAAARTREMALRVAMGAGRLRILRQLLTESTVLAVLGGLAGLLIAHWATRLLASVRVATDTPLYFDFSVDYQVFFYAATITMGVGIVAGLFPGIQASRANLSDALKQGGRSGTGSSRQTMRAILVAAQVAVSLILLISTGLFVRSLDNVSQIDPGFKTENRFMLALDPGLGNYDEPRTRVFFRDLLTRVRAIPGVRSAATAFSVPVGFNQIGGRVYEEGAGEGDKETRNRLITYNTVSSDYFSTMGVRVLDGRAFTDEDRSDTRKVAIVNQRMADLFWPGEEAIGKRISVDSPDGPFREVVGIAATGFYFVPGEAPNPHFYVPYSQYYRSSQILFVQGNDSNRLLPMIRREVAALDPDMPVSDVRTLRSHLVDGKAAILFRVPAAMLGIFALIGAVLAFTGLYGVIALSVTQRAHEIGVRVALGATTANVVRLISKKGLWLTGIGIVVGLGGTYAVTSIFANLLVGVSARDPLTYGTVSLLVFLTAMLACAIPARLRAGAIDPVDSLRGL